MTARHLAAILLAVLCFLSVPSHAQTGLSKAKERIRLESVTIADRGTELLVRFDRPVSHERSLLTLVRDGKVVATIYPRLEAAPNVLFARIPTPIPGNYIMRWMVCPEGSKDRFDGEFPFAVGQVAADSDKHPLRTGGGLHQTAQGASGDRP
jgi:hypothetical protein